MEDFSGLENGQKFRNDADESKWARLISAIKENSLRLVFIKSTGFCYFMPERKRKTMWKIVNRLG